MKRGAEGPLPAIDRLVAGTGAGSRLATLIEQSGVRTTPSAIVLAISLIAAVGLRGCSPGCSSAADPLALVAGADRRRRCRSSG